MLGWGGVPNTQVLPEWSRYSAFGEIYESPHFVYSFARIEVERHWGGRPDAAPCCHMLVATCPEKNLSVA